jgi:hypothetical protein
MNIERQFLNSYVDFGVRARTLAVRVLAKSYKEARSPDDKHLLHLLAIEEYAKAVEAFEAFFRAIQDRQRVPILDTIQKDFNPQNTVKRIEGKSVTDIFKQLNIAEERLKLQERELVRKEFEGIISALKDFAPHNQDFLIYVYNVLKHKFLIYRDRDRHLRPLLHPERQKAMKEKYGDLIALEDPPVDDIDYLVMMTEWMENATKEIIAIRLLEIQGNDPVSWESKRPGL